MPTYENQLLAGESLKSDEAIMSTSGAFTLTYQGDGNLVLYQNDPYIDRTPLWDSNTSGVWWMRLLWMRLLLRRGIPHMCIMQGDGNLVIYGPSGQYVWDAGTFGNPGARLVMQNDGNVVIYRSDGVAIWATNTVRSLYATPLPGGTRDAVWSIFLSQNADGRLELFANVPSQSEGRGGPRHIWQIVPNGPWSSWERFPRNPDSYTKVVGRNRDGRLVALGGGHGITQRWSSGPWPSYWSSMYNASDHERLSGIPSNRQRMAVAEDAAGFLVAFAISSLDGTPTSGSVWIAAQSPLGYWHFGSWSTFYSNDDRLDTISAQSNRMGCIEVFGTARDNTVWHTWQVEPNGRFNGGWVPFYSLENALNYIVVVRNSGGLLEAFGLYGVDSSLGLAIWHTRQLADGQWDGIWTAVPLPKNNTMTAICPLVGPAGSLELFGLTYWSSNGWGNCWQMSRVGESGAWGEWSPIEETITTGARPWFSSLATSRNQDGRIELFGLASGSLFQNRESRSGSAWEGWRQIHRFSV